MAPSTRRSPDPDPRARGGRPEPDAERPPAPASTPAPAGGSRRGAGIPAVALLTLLALAVGSGVGLYLADAVEDVVARRAAEAEEHDPVQLRFTDDTVLMRLQPVTANLGEPADVWVRLETAILFENGALANPDAAAAEIAQDILSYLRTVTLAELHGASALQFLREDLNDRVAIRTGGRVEELLIETMVVQ